MKLLICFFALALVFCVAAQANVIAPKKPAVLPKPQKKIELPLKWSCGIQKKILKLAWKDVKALPDFKNMQKIEKVGMKKILKKRASKLVKKNMPKNMMKKCLLKKLSKKNIKKSGKKNKLAELLLKKLMKKKIPKTEKKDKKVRKTDKKVAKKSVEKKPEQKKEQKPEFPKELKALLQKKKEEKKKLFPKKLLPKEPMNALKMLFMKSGKKIPKDTKKVLEGLFYKHLKPTKKTEIPAKKVEKKEKKAKKPAKKIEKKVEKAAEKKVQAKSDAESTVNAQCIINWARSKVGGCYSQSSRFGPCYDCSSFAYSAYQACGYDIGATSSGAYPGRMTAVSSPQPGDILWKSGHVAIYTGSGVIHAENERTGIRERDMNYFNSYFGYSKVYRL